MLKIRPKVSQNIQRYFSKNTTRAKYNRCMDAALVSGLTAGAEVLRMPHWEPFDMGLTAFCATVYIRNFFKAANHLLDLQPIRKRAIKIKKAAKLANKINNKKS